MRNYLRLYLTLFLAFVVVILGTAALGRALSPTRDTTTTVLVTTFNEDGERTGLGSGVVLKNGTILTARHVVTGAKVIKANKEDGTATEARLLWEDEETDTALLQAPFAALGYGSTLSCKEPVTVGQPVEIVGNPMGLLFIHTWGRIAGKERDFNGKTYFFLDASAGPGNSGGPVFDARGNVIGIVVAIVTAPLNMVDGTAIGLTVAVPSTVICGKIKDNDLV